MKRLFFILLFFPILTQAQFTVAGSVGGGAVAQTPVVATTVPGSALGFGNQNNNTSSSPQLATFVNTGGGAAPITSIASGDAEYALSSPISNSCLILSSIPGNGSCGVYVTFTPTSTGAHNSTLTLTSSGSTGSPVVVTLTGSGVNSCTSNCGGPNALTAGTCATVGATSPCNWGTVGVPTSPPGYPDGGTLPTLAAEQAMFCIGGNGTNSLGQSITGAWLHTTTGGWGANNKTCGFVNCGPAMMAAVNAIDSTFSATAACLDNPDSTVPLISYDGCYSLQNTSSGGRVLVLALTIPSRTGCSGSVPASAFYKELRGTPCGIITQCGNAVSGGNGMVVWSRVENHRLYGYCQALVGGVWVPTPTLCGWDPTTGTSVQYVNWQTVLGSIPLLTNSANIGGGYDCGRDTTSSGLPTTCSTAIARASETQNTWSLFGTVNLNTGDTYVVDFKLGNIYATGAYAGGACTGCVALTGGIHGGDQWQDNAHSFITLNGTGPVVATIGATTVTAVASSAGGGTTNGHRAPGGVGSSSMAVSLTSGVNGKLISAYAATPTALNYSIFRQGSGCTISPTTSCVPDQHNNFNMVDLNNSGLMSTASDTFTGAPSCPSPANPGQNEIDYVTWNGNSTTVVNPPTYYRVAPTIVDVCQNSGATQNQYGGTSSIQFYELGGMYQKSTNWNAQSGLNDSLGGAYHFSVIWNVF